jgi:hypothetical protein
MQWKEMRSDVLTKLQALLEDLNENKENVGEKSISEQDD